MQLFKKKLSRADAIAKAIDMSAAGDVISIHFVDCTDPNICTCQPKVLYIDDVEPSRKNPIGFRMNRNGR